MYFTVKEHRLHYGDLSLPNFAKSMSLAKVIGHSSFQGSEQLLVDVVDCMLNGGAVLDKGMYALFFVFLIDFCMVMIDTEYTVFAKKEKKIVTVLKLYLARFSSFLIVSNFPELERHFVIYITGISLVTSI